MQKSGREFIRRTALKDLISDIHGNFPALEAVIRDAIEILNMAKRPEYGPVSLQENWKQPESRPFRSYVSPKNMRLI